MGAAGRCNKVVPPDTMGKSVTWTTLSFPLLNVNPMSLAKFLVFTVAIGLCACNDTPTDPLAQNDTTPGLFFDFSGAASGTFGTAGASSIYLPPGWDPSAVETMATASHDTTSGTLGITGQVQITDTTVDAFMIEIVGLPKGTAIATPQDIPICTDTPTGICAKAVMTFDYVVHSQPLNMTSFYKVTSGTVRLSAVTATTLKGTFTGSAVGMTLPDRTLTGKKLTFSSGSFNVPLQNNGLLLGPPPSMM